MQGAEQKLEESKNGTVGKSLAIMKRKVDNETQEENIEIRNHEEIIEIRNHVENIEIRFSAKNSCRADRGVARLTVREDELPKTSRLGNITLRVLIE